jgi:hypothetical protein
MEDTSFMGRLGAAKALLAARRELEAKQAEPVVPEDSWLPVLAAVKGDKDQSGVASISTRQLCEILDIPQHLRKAGAFRRIAALMVSLGYQPNRVYNLNGRGFREQIRGFSRFEGLTSRPAASTPPSTNERRS